jgi:hypothetical protein
MTSEFEPGLTPAQLEAVLFEEWTAWICHCIAFGVPHDQWANVWYGAPIGRLAGQRLAVGQTH